MAIPLCCVTRRLRAAVLHQVLLFFLSAMLQKAVLPYEFPFQNQLETILFIVSALIIILGTMYSKSRSDSNPRGDARSAC